MADNGKLKVVKPIVERQDGKYVPAKAKDIIYAKDMVLSELGNKKLSTQIRQISTGELTARLLKFKNFTFYEEGDNLSIKGSGDQTLVSFDDKKVDFRRRAVFRQGAILENAPLRSNNFVSGMTGRGLLMDPNYRVFNEKNREFTDYGSYIEVDNLTVRGTFRVYELLASQIRATNGSLWVTSSAKTKSVRRKEEDRISRMFGKYDTSALSQYIVALDGDDYDYAPFTEGDLLKVKRLDGEEGYEINMIVVDVDNQTGGDPEFTVAWVEGSSLYERAPDEVQTVDYVRIGNTDDIDRQGAIHLNSDGPGGPTIDILDELSDFDSHREDDNEHLKVKLGDLRQHYDEDFGGYLEGRGGLYAVDNVYVKGNIKITNRKDQFDELLYLRSFENFQIDPHQLETQTDNRLVMWFADVEMAHEESPVAGWTESDRTAGRYDFYYNRSTGDAYRFIDNENDGSFEWRAITTEKVINTLSSVSELQAVTDDDKIVIFYQEDEPENAGLGDFWFNPINSDRKTFLIDEWTYAGNSFFGQDGKLNFPATPEGSGLFLGSRHMGFFDENFDDPYDSNNPGWKTYKDDRGNFYLKGEAEGGALLWEADKSTLTVVGAIRQRPVTKEVIPEYIFKNKWERYDRYNEWDIVQYSTPDSITEGSYVSTRTHLRGAWDSGNYYEHDDVVRHNGLEYRALPNGFSSHIAPDNDGTNWASNRQLASGTLDTIAGGAQFTASGMSALDTELIVNYFDVRPVQLIILDGVDRGIYDVEFIATNGDDLDIIIDQSVEFSGSSDCEFQVLGGELLHTGNGTGIANTHGFSVTLDADQEDRIADILDNHNKAYLEVVNGPDAGVYDLDYYSKIDGALVAKGDGPEFSDSAANYNLYIAELVDNYDSPTEDSDRWDIYVAPPEDSLKLLNMVASSNTISFNQDGTQTPHYVIFEAQPQNFETPDIDWNVTGDADQDISLLVWMGDYEESITYAHNGVITPVVKYGGNYYRLNESVADTGSDPDSSDWDLIEIDLSKLDEKNSRYAAILTADDIGNNRSLSVSVEAAEIFNETLFTDFDETTIVKLVENSDIISMAVTNPSHTFGAKEVEGGDLEVPSGSIQDAQTELHAYMGNERLGYNHQAATTSELDTGEFYVKNVEYPTSHSIPYTEDYQEATDGNYYVWTPVHGSDIDNNFFYNDARSTHSLITIECKIQAADGIKTFERSVRLNYTKSVDGSPFKALTLNPSTFAFKISEEGVYAPEEIRILADTNELLIHEQPRWKSNTPITIKTEDGSTVNLDSGTYRAPSEYIDIDAEDFRDIPEEELPLRIEASVTDVTHGEEYTDVYELNEIREGDSNLSVFIPNNTHAFPADVDRTIESSDIGVASSPVRVFRGFQELNFVNEFTSGGVNEFVIEDISPAGIITTAETADEYGMVNPDHSHEFFNNMDLTVDITFTIKAKIETKRGPEIIESEGEITWTKVPRGFDGKTAKLSANRYAITYTGGGVEEPADQTIELSVEENYHRGDIYYEFIVDGDTKPEWNTTSSTLTVPDEYEPKPGESIKLEVRTRENDPDSDYIATDSITIYGVKDGAEGYTVILTNESHSFTCENDRSVVGYEGGGTQIIVYEGADKLTHTTNSNPAPGEYNISIKSVDGIQAGTISNGTDGQGDTVGKAAHPINMTQDDASITYEANIKPLDGSENKTFEKRQSFSKSVKGDKPEMVKLEADRYAITYTGGGVEEPADQTINLTATESYHKGDVYYKFYVDGESQTSWNSESNTFTVPSDAEPGPGESLQLSVETRLGYSNADLVASDSITVYGVKDGGDSYTIIVTNGSHTVPSDNDESVFNMDDSGTRIIVFEGGNKLTHTTASSLNDGEYKISISDTYNITSDSDNISTSTDGEAEAVVSDHLTMGQNIPNGFVKYNIEIAPIDGSEHKIFERQQSFSKSIKGNKGDNAEVVKLESNTYTITYTGGGIEKPSDQNIVLTATTRNHNNPVYYRFLDGNEELRHDQNNTIDLSTVNINKPNPGESIELKVETREGTINTGVDPVATDSITIHGVKDGADSYNVVVRNETHTFPANKNNSVTDYSGGGTIIEVWEGADKMTYSPIPGDGQYKVNVTNASNIAQGNIVSDDSAVPNALIGAPSNMPDGSSGASIEFLITAHPSDGSSNKMITKKQTFSKSPKGDDGNDAKMLKIMAEGQVFVIDQDGGASPSELTLSVQESNISGTPTWTTMSGEYSGSLGTTNSVDIQVDDMESDSVTFQANLDGYTDKVTISKIYEGSDAYHITLTNESHTIHEDRNGNKTFGDSSTRVILYRGHNRIADGDFGISTSNNNVSSSINGKEVTVTDISDDAGSVDITITHNNSTIGEKTFSLSLSKEGPRGQEGRPGPGLVVQGEFDDTKTYYYNDNRRDVVLIGDTYMLANNKNKNGQSNWTNDDWTNFGTDVRSIATGLLLAEDATITHTLVMGTEDGDNPEVGNGGIIRSASMNNFASPSSSGGFWLGYDDVPTNTDNKGYKFFVGNTSNYLQWNGSEASVRGNIVATGGELQDLSITGGLEMKNSGSIKFLEDVDNDGNDERIFEISGDGIDLISGSNYGNINRIQWYEGSEVTGQLYSYRMSYTNHTVIRVPSNGGTYSTELTLTAGKVQVHADMHFNRTAYFETSADFNGNRLYNVGEMVLDFDTVYLTSNQARTVRTDTSLIIVNGSATNAGIHAIKNSDGSNPQIGKVVHIVNSSSADIQIYSTNWGNSNSDTNIIVQDNNGSRTLSRNSKMSLVYYIGGWHAEHDHGS